MPLSRRPLKNPHSQSLGFRCFFPVPVTIKVNGQEYNFPAVKDVVLDNSQFEAVRNSSYGQYLKPFFKRRQK